MRLLSQSSRWWILLAASLAGVLLLVSPGSAGTLTWEGDVSTNWFGGVAGTNTNWRNQAGQQVLPVAGDDLVFTSTGTYTGDLTLGGTTIALNSITVGAPGDTAMGGPSDFGVSVRNLATNGTIQLGAGGMTVYFAYGTQDYALGNTREIRFNTDLQLTASTFVRGIFASNTYRHANRRIYLGGNISGGSPGSPITFELSSPNGGDGTSKAIQVERAMPNLYAALKLNGTTTFTSTGAIWGDPSNEVHLSIGALSSITNVYAWHSASGNLTTPNNLVFASNRTVLLFNAGGTGSTWAFTGNVSGGNAAQPLDLLGSNDSLFDFRGTSQTFANRVEIRTGVGAVISGAEASGVAWPNVSSIRLNSGSLSAGTTRMFVRGDFRLAAPIDIIDQATATIPVRIGQLNEGATPFDAVFAGRVNCLEDDFQVLHLTADAGGSATFAEQIRVKGGTYGFNKVGAGTVSLQHRVSEDFTNTNPIGPVNVQQGTLLVNSPGGNDSLVATAVNVANDATLGGSGRIVGNVNLNGTTAATLAPGASIGTLTVAGNVDFASAGQFLVEVGSASADCLDVSGLLDLSANDDRLVVQLTGFPALSSYTIARYGTLSGRFDTVDLSALPPGFRLDYQFNGMNEIALVVPEPSTGLLLMLGVVAFAVRFRRASKA